MLSNQQFPISQCHLEATLFHRVSMAHMSTTTSMLDFEVVAVHCLFLASGCHNANIWADDPTYQVLYIILI